MLNILIITTQYSEADLIRNILRGHRERFSICGMASNSVSGMTMIESVSPDVVIMPAIISFWNAIDLINSLLVRGNCPLFILLHEDEKLSYGAAIDSQIVDIIPAAALGEARLIAALARAETISGQVVLPMYDLENTSIVQHSLDLSNLASGMITASAAKIRAEYGELTLRERNCWIMLATPTSSDAPQNLFEDIDLLTNLLVELPEAFRGQGDADVCVYHESNFCMLLTEDAERPEWPLIISTINRIFEREGFPSYEFQISDEPSPVEEWPAVCRKLLAIREKRFFYSPLYLQPKMLEQYKRFVTQDDLMARLSELMLAVRNLDQLQLIASMKELERLVNHSLSMTVYSTVFTQLAVILNRLLHQFSLEKHEDRLSLQMAENQTLEQAFAQMTQRFLELYMLIKNNTGSHNQLISNLCVYIEQHLDEKLSLSVLAGQVHMNPSYLSRLFKEETKVPLSEYIAQKRVARAKTLLQGPYKIITIAEMTGFNDARYFSQVFRRYTGKTPQQYRKELGG